MKHSMVLILAIVAVLGAAGAHAGSETEAAAHAASSTPLRGEANAAKHGQTLFDAMNCDGCHGGGGSGYVGPSLIDGRWRFGGDEGEVFRSIRDGHAQGMPAYGVMLTDATIWQLVTYLQSLPLAKDVPTLAWP
jgi:cytochrome c oxidase cbb3-type subunit 3